MLCSRIVSHSRRRPVKPPWYVRYLTAIGAIGIVSAGLIAGLIEWPFALVGPLLYVFFVELWFLFRPAIREGEIATERRGLVQWFTEPVG